MTCEVDENPYQALEQPISDALEMIAAVSGGDVEFGPEAAQVNQVSGSARPTSLAAEVLYLGEVVGSLTTVIFKPYDGTGNPSAGRVYDSGGGFFLETARIIPRMDEEAQAIHGDVHLAIASFKGEAPNFNPRLLAGSLSLFGRSGGAVELGYLGQDNVAFGEVMAGRQQPTPAVTKTVNPERLNPAFSGTYSNPRANDLRAVYARYPGIYQVAGFITLYRGDDEKISRVQASMLDSLGAVEPVHGKAHR